MKKFGIEVTPETSEKPTEGGEGDGKPVSGGAAYISASAAAVVLGALLQ